MTKIGTAKIVKGEKTTGYLTLGSDVDGQALEIPVLVASGNVDGPVVWVTGCIHGDEYGGAATIINYFKNIDLDKLKGTFVGVPVVNYFSYKAWSRISALDGANLNRVFPGNPDGTYSQQLAHLLLDEIKSSADYVLDLHSGGLALHVPYFVICKDGNSDAVEKSKWLAKRMGTKIIWHAQPDGSADGTGTDHYVNNGIPSVTVEVGGGTVDENQVEVFTVAIDNAFQALEIHPGTPPLFEENEYDVYTKAEFIFTKKGGMFFPNKKAGEMLRENELIGSIVNLYGDVVEEIRNPMGEAFLAATGNSYWPTEPGRLIVEVYAK